MYILSLHFFFKDFVLNPQVGNDDNIDELELIGEKDSSCVDELELPIFDQVKGQTCKCQPPKFLYYNFAKSVKNKNRPYARCPLWDPNNKKKGCRFFFWLEKKNSFENSNNKERTCKIYKLNVYKFYLFIKRKFVANILELVIIL